MSWFGRLKAGLQKSTGKLSTGINGLFTGRKLDDAALEELEELLITADIGTATAMHLTATLAKNRFGKEVTAEEVRHYLATEITKILQPHVQPLQWQKGQGMQIILVAGVNGSGKTTTIGKLAAQAKAAGCAVAVVAGDTFRAGAVAQLEVWAQRAGVPCYTTKANGDAAALAFDSVQQAQKAGIDILFIDTAGRLHNQENLMAELEKIQRVIKKFDAAAPQQRLLVLDATTGQTALRQVEIFQKSIDISGLIVTKLDGTAKGGMVIALAAQLGLPLHAIGVGEQIEDLQAFEAERFAQALVGLEG